MSKDKIVSTAAPDDSASSETDDATSPGPNTLDGVLGCFVLVAVLGYLIFAAIVVLTGGWDWTEMGWMLAGGVGLLLGLGMLFSLIDGLKSSGHRLLPWDRPRRFLLTYPFWSLVMMAVAGAGVGAIRDGTAGHVGFRAVQGILLSAATTPFWFVGVPWLRAFFRFPHVLRTTLIQTAAFAGCIWYLRDSSWQALYAGVWGFVLALVSSSRAKDTVSDRQRVRQVVDNLLAAGGQSLRSAAMIVHAAIEQHPRDAWLHYARAVVLTGKHPRSLGFPEFHPDYTTRAEAITDLNLAIDLDSSLTDAWLLRARQKAFFTGAPELGLDLAFDADNVLADFNEAIRQAPQRADVYFERGFFYEQRLQAYSKAEADFSKTIKLSEPTAETLLARGRVRCHQEAFEAVIEDMSRVIQLDPDGVAGDAFCFRGEARRALGLFDEAASDFRLAINARRDSLRKRGDAAGAEQPDERVFDAAYRGLMEVGG